MVSFLSLVPKRLTYKQAKRFCKKQGTTRCPSRLVQVDNVRQVYLHAMATNVRRPWLHHWCIL